MNHFFQKLRSIFRRTPRQRGLFGTPLWAAAREEAERQTAESNHTERFICGTFLTRMAADEDENPYQDDFLTTMSQEVFWMPTDVEDSQMIPLSVPGPTPPRDQGDHRQRLLEHLRFLAQQLEDEEGVGAVYQVAAQYLPDENIRMALETMSPDELIQLMAISSSLNMTAMRDPKAVTRDQTLQQDCREMGLEERLAAIGYAF